MELRSKLEMLPGDLIVVQQVKKPTSLDEVAVSIPGLNRG